MASVPVSEPTTVQGGASVVKFEPPPPPEPKRTKNPKPKPKLEPEQQKQRGELLSAKEFVKKYQMEVKTAAWDPKVLRKCGRGAEQILMSLGAHQHKEKVPLREQARRKKLHQEQAELEGQYRRDIKRKKKK